MPLTDSGTDNNEIDCDSTSERQVIEEEEMDSSINLSDFSSDDPELTS